MTYAITIASTAICFLPLTGLNDVSACCLAAGVVLLGKAFGRKK